MVKFTYFGPRSGQEDFSGDFCDDKEMRLKGDEVTGRNTGGNYDNEGELVGFKELLNHFRPWATFFSPVLHFTL